MLTVIDCESQQESWRAMSILVYRLRKHKASSRFFCGCLNIIHRFFKFCTTFFSFLPIFYYLHNLENCHLCNLSVNFPFIRTIDCAIAFFFLFFHCEIPENLL